MPATPLTARALSQTRRPFVVSMTCEMSTAQQWIYGLLEHTVIYINLVQVFQCLQASIDLFTKST